MYKIMLVEDESAVLNAMANIIDWNSLSFHTPVACANGKEAIAAIDEGFIPDAVITDICMPFVDGVELTEYLSRHCPQTLVVLLTGYDDFAYAQKAIKLKVYDYVLKPITPKNICQLATRVCDELENRRIKNADNLDELAREQFFIKLLTSQLDEKTVLDNFRVHNISDSKPFWCVLAADPGLTAAVTASENRSNELSRYGLCNITSELAQSFDGAVAFVPVKDTGCVILNGESPEILRTSAQSLALKISKACKMIHLDSTCGVGRAVDSPMALHNSYLQAVLSLHYRFFFGSVPYILSEDTDAQPCGEFDYSVYERQLTSALKQVSRNDTLNMVDDMFASFARHKLPYALCVRYCQRTVLHLLDRMSEYLSSEEMTHLEHAWDNTNYFSATTLAQLQGMLHEVCELSFDSFARMNEDDATMRVRKAEAYIREHYSDDTLSLNTIRDRKSVV